MTGRMVTRTAMQIAPAGLEHTDKPAWLALRKDGLGGSDIAPVMGMGRKGGYGRTAWQVYLDKTMDLPDDLGADKRAEEQAWFGHQMETVAARRFRMTHPGTRLVRCGMLARAGQPWMRVNIDRRVLGCDGGPCGWECKTRSAYLAAAWDPHGDPEAVPDDAALQCHWAMMITGYRHWHLVVVIGGNELREYRIDASPDLHQTIYDETRWFWHECVLARQAPPVDSAERTGRLLARLWKVDPGKVVTATPAIAARYQDLLAATARAADADADADLIKHELMEWAGDAEVVLHPDGHELFTWRQNGTFREKDFRRDHPGEAGYYMRLAATTDTGWLAAEEPALYAAYRARTFKLSAQPKDN